MKNLKELIDLMTLEKLDDCLFRGQNYHTPWNIIYGGQVLGQALAAAYDTVPKDRYAHSLHAYFILPGDVSVPVIYQVQVIRDGGSFTTRRVTAKQKGRPIFVMATSFQLEQDGFDHQEVMPEVTPPNELKTILEQAETIKESMPSLYRRVRISQQKAFHFKSVEDLFDKKAIDNLSRNVWMKTSESIEMDIRMQHQVLAYISDANLLIAAAAPHMSEENAHKLFMASLDHAMWFHRGFDLNKWLLYSVGSPSASNSRGLGYGRIFDENGALVSTVIQEGLLRELRSK